MGKEEALERHSGTKNLQSYSGKRAVTHGARERSELCQQEDLTDLSHVSIHIYKSAKLTFVYLYSFFFSRLKAEGDGGKVAQLIQRLPGIHKTLG